MDAQRGPRAGRPATRRLKDISHLYLSTARPAARVDPAWQPAPRRTLRLAVLGPARAAARAEFTADLALAFARLGRRVAVLDLDAALPNVGCRLALAPADYLAHLAPESSPQLVTGLAGVRVLCGVAGRRPLVELPIPLRDALRGFEVVLAMLPSHGDAGHALRDLGTCVPSPPVETTLARAAHRSPMIGAWLATAQRPPTSNAGPTSDAGDASSSAAESALWVEEVGRPGAANEARPEILEGVGVRTVGWRADVAAPDPALWARIPAHATGRLPIAALDPAHPVAKLFDGLAQSLLAAPPRSALLSRPAGDRRVPDGSGSRPGGPVLHPEISAYLEEIRDLPCAPLLTLLVHQIAALDAALDAEVGAFGIRFHAANVLVCEISVFGELFIARIGRDQAVEYRVRHEGVLLEAIDRILQALAAEPPVRG